MPGVQELRFAPGARHIVGMIGAWRGGLFSCPWIENARCVVWDADTGKAVASPDGKCRRFALSRDGASLAVGLEGTVHLIPLCGGGHPLVVAADARALIFAPDGARLIAFGGRPVSWDRRTGRQLNTAPARPGHQSRVNELRFLGRKTLTSSGDERLWWDAYTGEALPPPRVKRALFEWPADWKPSPDVGIDMNAGLIVVVRRWDKVVTVLDGATGVRIRQIGDPSDHDRPSELLRQSDGSLWVLRSFGGFHSEYALLDPETGRQGGVCYSFAPWALSPDGRLLAVEHRDIDFLETASGARLGTMPVHELARYSAMAFSPDNTLLATGSVDGTILTWDWRHACGIFPMKGTPEAAWDTLASADARRAQSAMLRLSRPDALPMIARRLAPVTLADCRKIREALRRLDDDDFEIRHAAERALGKPIADDFFLFHEMLATRPSLDVVRRIERLMGSSSSAWTSDMLRRLRAAEALERMGTPGARALLRRVAEGEPRARLTREARAALAR
jgi:hypothetical protein